MKPLHLQQVPVVAHTTHNRLRPDLTKPNTTNLTQPHPPPNRPHTTSYPRPHQNIPSIHLSFHPSTHAHPYADAYTLTRSIVNKLLTLYISIDILTFMWYNNDNGEGRFYMLNI